MNSYFTPPMNIAIRDQQKHYYFLAGSIEMGKAENWQREIANFLNYYDFGVFNPRRKDWDSSLEQDFENPQFYQQVNWELDALEKADKIIMYLQPNTISPISLLELGRFYEKILVICPDGFARKGNVEIFCNRYNIPLFESISQFQDEFIREYNLKK
jgi:Nucleoside 2-deoxyribosyltransferase like